MRTAVAFANFTIFQSSGAQGLPPAMAESWLVPICGPVGWDLHLAVPHGLSLVGAVAGNGRLHGGGLLSPSHTTHLILIGLVF